MKYEIRKPAVILLEDGTFMTGISVGGQGTSGGEICFNTGMTGYQEIYTDPSYYGQIIVNTHTHIGNYGVTPAEEESDKPRIKGVVINQFSELFSRAMAEGSLQDYLEKNGVVGIAEIDTRKLVRHIRKAGAMNAIISSEILDKDQLTTELEKIPSMKGLELSSKACTSAPYFYGNEKTATKRVAVLDLGCKRNILRSLTARGAYCKVFPATTPVDEIKSWVADAYFVSNGPGDPAAMGYAVETVKSLQEENKPMFGICLGHQILALANNATTYKMHHGHRGCNQPVKNLISGGGEITSQNHGFSVSEDSIRDSETLEITHINLNDKTIEGIQVKGKPIFSVQYHPEAAPGPHDSRYLFDQFIQSVN